mmetsp:Transcript_39216/g.80349  ORF Transcript_39216/g.80349 Transcript_39216/m.80349 type:complete len:471 (+) Transcript_39216:420-1832(+)
MDPLMPPPSPMQPVPPLEPSPVVPALAPVATLPAPAPVAMAAAPPAAVPPHQEEQQKGQPQPVPQPQPQPQQAEVAVRAQSHGVAKASARTGRWTEKEKALFIQGFSLHSNASFRWKKISEFVGTRTAIQCKTHHQKIIGGAKTKRNVEAPLAPVLHPGAAAAAPGGDGGGGGSGFLLAPMADVNGEGENRMQSLLDVTTAEQHPSSSATGLGAAAAADSQAAQAAAASAAAAVAAAGGGGVGSGPGMDDFVMPNLDSTFVDQNGNPIVPHSTSSAAASSISHLPDDNDEPTKPAFGRWTEAEKIRFDDAMRLYGRGRWKSVSKLVGTRTSTQCKTHHQKMQERLEKEKKKQMGTGSIAKSPVTASPAMPLVGPAPILPEDVVGGEGGGGGIFDNPPTAEAPMEVTAVPDATVDGAVASAVAAAVAAAAAAASASAAAPAAASAEMEADVAKTLVSYKSVSDAAENAVSI